METGAIAVVPATDMWGARGEKKSHLRIKICQPCSSTAHCVPLPVVTQGESLSPPLAVLRPLSLAQFLSFKESFSMVSSNHKNKLKVTDEDEVMYLSSPFNF